jgi:hypothetical protein
MAAKKENSGVKKVTIKISRPGVHSKKKSSGLKTSKNYKKPYNRQGR